MGSPGGSSLCVFWLRIRARVSSKFRPHRPISDGRGRALRCRPREMSATSWGLFAIVILTALGYKFWQRRSSGFLPVPTEEPQTTGSYQQEEDERLLRQAKSEGNRFITDVHL